MSFSIENNNISTLSFETEIHWMTIFPVNGQKYVDIYKSFVRKHTENVYERWSKEVAEDKSGLFQIKYYFLLQNP